MCKRGQSPRRLRRHPPLHKGGYTNLGLSTWEPTSNLSLPCVRGGAVTVLRRWGCKTGQSLTRFAGAPFTQGSLEDEIMLPCPRSCCTSPHKGACITQASPVQGEVARRRRDGGVVFPIYFTYMPSVCHTANALPCVHNEKKFLNSRRMEKTIFLCFINCDLMHYH